MTAVGLRDDDDDDDDCAFCRNVMSVVAGQWRTLDATVHPVSCRSQPARPPASYQPVVSADYGHCGSFVRPDRRRRRGRRQIDSNRCSAPYRADQIPDLRGPPLAGLAEVARLRPFDEEKPTFTNSGMYRNLPA